jgi:hypothetical protein
MLVGQLSNMYPSVSTGAVVMLFVLLGLALLQAVAVWIWGRNLSDPRPAKGQRRERLRADFTCVEFGAKEFGISGRDR